MENSYPIKIILSYTQMEEGQHMNRSEINICCSYKYDVNLSNITILFYTFPVYYHFYFIFYVHK